MNSFESDLDPNERIKKLVRDTGMPLTVFGDAVGWRSSEVLRWWSAQGLKIDEKKVESLSRYLGIAADSLVAGTYSKNLVRERIFVGPQILPERYAENASSFVRSSAHIIEYLSLRYGRHYTDKVLLGLNIHPLIFNNLDNRINLLFFIDLLNQLNRSGLTPMEVSSLACYLFLRVQNTEVGRRFAQASTYQDSYVVLSEMIARYEANFEYDFSIDSKNIRITAKPTEAERFLQLNHPKDLELLFAYRRMAFGWFPILSELAPLNLMARTETVRGNTVNVYEARLDADHLNGFGGRLASFGGLKLC